MKNKIEISPVEWDVIETYLEQENASEREIFWREKLVTIPNVEEKIAHIAKIREEIVDSIRQSKIKEFHEKVSVDENGGNVKMLPAGKSNPRIIWYSIAAVLVVAFGILWILQHRPPSEKIFAENFKPDIGLPLKMGTTNNLEFYEGMVDYKQGEYQKAIDQWQVLWSENPQNDTLNYFLGVANLAQDDTKKSLKYFENQEVFQQGIFKEDAAYYAALAKIKDGKFEEAKALLQENPSERNTNLLRQLEDL